MQPIYKVTEFSPHKARPELAVVLLHGLAGSSEHWRYQVDAFSDLSRVIAIDYPGHSKGGTATGDLGLWDLVDAIEKVIEQEKVSRAILVGHSMGGLLARMLLSRCPNRIVGAIFVDAPPIALPVSSAEKIARALTPRVFAKPILRKVIRDLVGQNASHALAAQVMSDFENADVDTLLSLTISLIDRKTSPSFAIEVPCLCIVGRDGLYGDPKLEPEVARWASQLSYVSVPDAGHYVMLQAPAQTNAAIASFLQAF